MNLHLKKIKLYQRDSGRPFRLVDLLIKDGLIHKIGKDLRTPKGFEKFDGQESYASLGWMDVGIQQGEPGFEYREDFESLQKASAQGGFTSVVAFPNTYPEVDNKAQVEFIKSQNSQAGVQIHPIGAVSKKCEGKELAELYDMHNSGALAFSDGKTAIQSAGLMLRALQYVKGFDGLVINIPNDQSISNGGQVNEGLISLSLGLKGISHLSEEIMAQRDIELAEYTDSKVHLANISSAGTVDLIRKAKRKGIKVTASVPILNLLFHDEQIASFDSSYKVWPPLRTKKDSKALKKGILDGSIDFICSNHVPLEAEQKHKEFLYAGFGAIGLETTFSLCLRLLDKNLKLNDLVELFAYKTREVLNIPILEPKVGEPANLTIFNPKQKWTYQGSSIKSKSKNSPLFGKKLVGKVIAIVNNNRLIVNS